MGNEQMVEHNAKIKMNSLKIKAIINLLSKEGIITHKEVEAELEKLIKESEDE